MTEQLTEKDLISFGEYLLSEKRTDSIWNNTIYSTNELVEERLAQVLDADLENWKEQQIDQSEWMRVNINCINPLTGDRTVKQFITPSRNIEITAKKYI